jgi:4-hydroxybenzoate polyprenyltransferase
VALGLALRPKQWTKNAVVFAAVVFDLHLFRASTFATSLGAFICFCLASSVVYLVNDLQDIESDRAHPLKRLRPIAAGRVSPQLVWLTVGALLLVAVPLALALRPAFALVLAGYLALMAAYTYRLKHMVLLALFIGFGKRRHELLLLEGAAGAHRRNLDEYTPELLDQFILITAAATIMAYSLYTFVASNVPDDHSMMLTIPFVLYAVFRYLFLIHRRNGGGSPEQLLLTDHALLASIALWGISCVAILYL